MYWKFQLRRPRQTIFKFHLRLQCFLDIPEINECESFPCYGFGKCIDLVNDYQCRCNPGYEIKNNDSHHECIRT